MLFTTTNIQQLRLMMREELFDIRQRLERVVENTAITRRILEKNELNERSSFGRRLVKLESGMQKISTAASSIKS